MKIIDCFPFFQEKDILKLRLHELNNYVDNFLISELNVTHSGIKKKSIFNSLKKEIPEFLPKIHSIIGKESEVTDFYYELARGHGVIPHLQNDNQHEKKRISNWGREVYQRCILEKLLNKLELDKDDIIILSDVDEIPDPKILSSIREGKIDLNNNILILEQDMFIYSFHYYHQKFRGTRIMTWGNFLKSNLTLDHLRTKTHEFPFENKVLLDSGWHLSYFGDFKTILKKYISYTHSCDPTQKIYSDNNLNETEKIELIKTRFKDMIDKNQLIYLENPIFPPVCYGKELFVELLH
jgi:beta-1,4-mannosyl-glycoprotein beta-1,4-N-acetylglucosaminyltransferase